MTYIIKRMEPERSEAILRYMKNRGKIEQNLFLEFCSFLEVGLKQNNNFYEADLTPYQLERLRTSVLVESIEYKMS